jgi:hypothetical protein
MKSPFSEVRHVDLAYMDVRDSWKKCLHTVGGHHYFAVGRSFSTNQILSHPLFVTFSGVLSLKSKYYLK